MKQELVKEAIGVGLGAIPIFLTTSAILDAMAPKDSPLRSPAMKYFVGGLAFHLAADATGWNRWYLEHSYEAKKAMAVEYDYTMDWYANRSGFGGGRYLPY